MTPYGRNVRLHHCLFPFSKQKEQRVFQRGLRAQARKSELKSSSGPAIQLDMLPKTRVITGLGHLIIPSWSHFFLTWLSEESQVRKKCDQLKWTLKCENSWESICHMHVLYMSHYIQSLVLFWKKNHAGGGDGQQATEFFREMKTLMLVGSHPNVVSLLGVCTQNGEWWSRIWRVSRGDVRPMFSGCFSLKLGMVSNCWTFLKIQTTFRTGRVKAYSDWKCPTLDNFASERPIITEQITTLRYFWGGGGGI